jgi:hypothetical protein
MKRINDYKNVHTFYVNEKWNKIFKKINDIEQKNDGWINMWVKFNKYKQTSYKYTHKSGTKQVLILRRPSLLYLQLCT